MLTGGTILSNQEILDNARTVDMVTDKAFIERSRGAKLPKPITLDDAPEYPAPSHHRSFRDPLAAQLQLYFDEPIDGRVVAVRFMDHLEDHGEGIHYWVGTPVLLHHSSSELGRLRRRLTDITNPDKSRRKELENLRINIGNLDIYASGRIPIFRDPIPAEQLLRYYFDGAAPQTRSVLIAVPIGSNHGSQAALYKGFLEKLSK